VKTADRYMAVANLADQLDNLSNPEVLNDFPVSALYLLGQLKTPEVAAKIIAGAAPGKRHSVKDVKAAIDAATSPAPKAPAPAKVVPESEVPATPPQRVETPAPAVETSAPVAEPIEVPSPPRFHADMAAALDEIESLMRKLVDVADRNLGALLSERTLLIGLDRLRTWLDERERKSRKPDYQKQITEAVGVPEFLKRLH
jgi:hypothetical protein